MVTVLELTVVDSDVISLVVVVSSGLSVEDVVVVLTVSFFVVNPLSVGVVVVDMSDVVDEVEPVVLSADVVVTCSVVTFPASVVVPTDGVFDVVVIIDEVVGEAVEVVGAKVHSSFETSMHLILIS